MDAKVPTTSIGRKRLLYPRKLEDASVKLEVKGLAFAQEKEAEKIIQGRNIASQMNVAQCLIPSDSSQHEENVMAKSISCNFPYSSA